MCTKEHAGLLMGSLLKGDKNTLKLDCRDGQIPLYILKYFKKPQNYILSEISCVVCELHFNKAGIKTNDKGR